MFIELERTYFMENKYINLLLSNQDYFIDFVTRMTYHTNAIEGSSMSFDETFALLFNYGHAPINTTKAREIHEAENHKKVLEYLVEVVKNKEILTEDVIMNFCQIIQHDIISIVGYRLGNMRIVGSNQSFPLPKDIEVLMCDFVNKYNEKLLTSFSFEDLARMHIDFEYIHPFEDGNGRTGRILINYYLLMNLKAPLVIPFETREEYLNYIRTKDVVGLAKFLDGLQKKEESIALDYRKK